MDYDVNVEGINFECQVKWDRFHLGRLDEVAIFLKGSDVELTGVLSNEVIQKIDEELYRQGPSEPDYNPSEDR